MINRSKQGGFSLVEMMVVLAILGILFVGVTEGMKSFQETELGKSNNEKLDLVKQQLLKFVQAEKYLLCPDSDGDGYENRTPSAVVIGTLGNVQACTVSYGTVPYRDLGLKESQAVDAWNNAIAYAVNTQTTDAQKICDKTEAASMFCNLVPGVLWFSLADTPPLAINRGDGNYYICKLGVAQCDATFVLDSNNVLQDATVVLVAFNQTGQQAWDDCSELSTSQQENCDADLYYQKQSYSSGGVIDDDQIQTINGYEIKALAMGTVMTWNAFDSASSAADLTPTYEAFDIAAGDDVSSLYSSDSDVVMINHDVDQAVRLGNGDDYMVIGNDLNANANLALNKGNDSLYIVGSSYSNVNLGLGDDTMVLGGDLTNNLSAQAGNDRVWIQGSVLSGSSLDLGKNDDVLWLGKSDNADSGQIFTTLQGGDGYDIVVFENQASWSDLSASEQSNLQNFELAIFKTGSDGGSGRAYCFLDGSSPSCY
ncbi:type II secretion system protein [Thiomicrorhabdus sediminis]|uniref:Prepilin-type N-terminal cleavage/methylation domain-containing protein n=1 Tax=Thiomicrorhabdus sediminis TaxID=2580412 RepID=A0A4V1HHZ9_9GAMM|nr:prepilin-type N-terminal cleavage/methylation domain-containing protein [Thiomicrorhabdus sediminis]QCU90783.1 prepilin-type N-terminal cleavage/methylation domain-containing protein [Thiomicrorhabdus sediminis]